MSVRPQDWINLCRFRAQLAGFVQLAILLNSAGWPADRQVPTTFETKAAFSIHGSFMCVPWQQVNAAEISSLLPSGSRKPLVSRAADTQLLQGKASDREGHSCYKHFMRAEKLSGT